MAAQVRRAVAGCVYPMRPDAACGPGPLAAGFLATSPHVSESVRGKLVGSFPPSPSSPLAPIGWLT